jgi:UDP-N-acetylglucosamine--N-acetylmuramyl-(pentapeptide) pyrophosphoryl-undecaprenol N-acetylglucosamine transferase
MENHLMAKKIHYTKNKIIISGIGTGGHYFPALVIAEELMKRNIEVIFLVRKGYMEEKVAQNYGLKIFYIKSQPFYGKTLFAKLIFCFCLIYSIYRLAVLTKNSIGLAFGGFGSLPLIISCLLNRSNFFIFDPNRVPGRATRLFATQATNVFLGLPPETKPKGKYIVTGIPVRGPFKKQLIIRQRRRTYRGKHLLFIGGSQGARLLSRYALSLGHILPKKFKLTIISGHRDYAWVNGQKDSRTTVIAFSNSPWCEIRAADIIISRAGALAGYEILFLNKPTIFIPYPYAIDNHQYYNAEYFSSIGNAIVIDEKDVTTELLVEKINELLHCKAKSKIGIITDAENKIADLILAESKARCIDVR